MIGILKVGLIYFGIVFSVGFLLGAIRVPFMVPLIGQRTAELIELPFMLAAIFFSARWIVRRYDPRSRVRALAIGIVAAALLLLVEFSVVLWIRGLMLSEILADRDPVAAGFYYIAVAMFAAMPAVISFNFGGQKMNKDAIVVLHGFFQLSNLQKKKVVDAINEYFDSMDREPIRAEYDSEFAKLKSDGPSFECKCCERSY